MSTIKGEFYRSNEYNTTTDYKHFPAEMYLEKREIGETGKEYASSGAEITTFTEKRKT